MFFYWYDGFNQLQRVQNPDGKFIDYTYNGTGLRTKKDFGDKAVNYFYDKGNIILETDHTNKATAKNIRGLRLIYRENNPGQTDAQFLYYLHNAHGDVTQLLNDKAEVVKDYRYGTYGQEEILGQQVFGGKQSVELWRQEVEKIDNPFRYCGEYLDEETGNYYLRARYYDPSTQRFISEDSYNTLIGAGWTQHVYGYAGNNPIRYIDPTGHIIADFLTEKSEKGKAAKGLVAKVRTAITSYNANGTWITARKSGNSTAVLVRLIAYAYGANVSWDKQSKQAAVTLNGETRWFSSKNFYTENGQMWISPETFKSMFGIKRASEVKKSTTTATNSNWEALKRGVGGISNIPDIARNNKQAFKNTMVSVSELTPIPGAGLPLKAYNLIPGQPNIEADVNTKQALNKAKWMGPANITKTVMVDIPETGRNILEGLSTVGQWMEKYGEWAIRNGIPN